MKRPSRKILLVPPMREKAAEKYIVVVDRTWRSAEDIVYGLLARRKYRGHRAAVALEIQNDLIRFHGLKGLPIKVSISGGKPVLNFALPAIEAWLDEEGGRAWIFAELEARREASCADKVRGVVVQFPGRPAS